MARNDVFLNINALSPADAVVTGQQDMTAATVPELVLGDTPTFNFYFTDNTNVWPSWAGNAAYTVTWALSDAVSGDFSPAATTGNATPITGGWSVVLPLNAYDLVGLLNTKRVSQPYPVTNLWQQIRVADPSGNEVTRAMFWTPIRYRAISDTQNTESASPTGGREVTVDNVNVLTTPTAAQFYAANPVPTSALGSAANGELLIGNGTGFTKSTLTAGTGITVTNGSGSITIDASGAQETLTATVKNAESVAITKGQVVYLFGATGNMPSVKLAYNTSDATSAKTFGVVSDTSIAPNGTGTVTCVGVVDGLNLGAYQDGDTLYLGATPGSVTATKPYAPNHLVYVGIVERANAGNGELYVRVQNGYELDEIHDVQINAPRQSGQTLIYDNTTSLWKNARITAGSNIAVTNGDGSISIGFSGTLLVANGGTGVTTSTGSGSVVLSTSPTLTTPILGTPQSGTLSSCTGLPISTGVSGLGTNVATFLATPSSANLASSVTDETGTGALVFANTPTLVTPNIGAATGTSVNLSGAGTFGGNLTVSNLITSAASSALVLRGDNATGGILTLNVAGTSTADFTQGNGRVVTTNTNSPEFRASRSSVIAALGVDATGGYVGTLTAATSLSLYANGTVAATLSATNGNFLIGTTTDGGQKLQVNGQLRAGSATSFCLINNDGTGQLYAESSGTAQLTLTSGGAFDWRIRGGSTTMVLRRDSTDMLTFDSSSNATFAGNALISHATGSNSKLSVIKNTAPALNHVAQVVLGQGVGGGFGANDRTYQLVNNGESSTAAYFGIQYWDGSNYNLRLKIDSTGNATLGGNLTVSGTGTSSVAGSLGVGTTSPASLFETSKDSGYQVLLSEYSNNTNRVDLVFRKSRGSAASPATTQVGDYLGIIDFQGRASSSFTVGAEILSQVEAVGGSVYGNLIFSTNDLGGGGITERIRLTNSGNLLLKSDGIDSSNGKLQLATHTTSAGGIGFGTDVALYRRAANSLAAQSGSTEVLSLENTTAAGNIDFYYIINGTKKGTLTYDSSVDSFIFYLGSNNVAQFSKTGSILLRPNGTTALTLDSSQNATFAGKITATSSSQGILSLTGSSNTGTNIRLKNTGTNGRDWGINSNVTLGQGEFSLYDYTAGYESFRITATSTGTVTIYPTGGLVVENGPIKTAAPSGGTAATWRLGTVASVSPTSPNRTIEVEIGGTTYYIHAKTTNN